MQPVTKINPKLIFFTILIILLKNSYYFFISDYDPYRLGGGSSLLFVWHLIFESYYAFFAVVCLCFALLFMQRRSYAQAFCFVSLVLLLSPLHTLYKTYQHSFHPDFVFEDSAADLAQNKLNWLKRSIHLLLPLCWIAVICIAAVFRKKLNQSYSIIAAAVVICYICALSFDITLWNSDKSNFFITAMMPVYVRSIIISSIIIWLVPIFNYVNETVRYKKISELLLYVSLFINLLCCIMLIKLMPDENQRIPYLLIAAVQPVNILFLFLQRKYPRKEISILLPVIQLLAGALLIAVYSGDFHYSFFPPELKVLLRASFIAVIPAAFIVVIVVLGVQLFKERRVEE